ncbi:MAG: hypothetical protein ACR2HR_16055 [Euzebya sp.]
MNGVVALGRHSGPFLERPTHVVHVDPEPVLADLSMMHVMLQEQLNLQESLVVVYPSRLGGTPARALSTVRAAMNGPPILWHATDLPPLAADVLVTLAGALSTTLGGAPMVAAALKILELQLVHITWVPSVARLSDPAPTVWQHAKSALPHTSWLVSSWPEPSIRRLDLEDLPPVPRTTQEIGIAMADLGGDVSWVEPVIGTNLPAAVGVQVEPAPDTSAWWGCKQVSQVVLYPRSIDVLTGLLSTKLHAGVCTWCQRMVGDEICPWCELPRSGVTRLGTTSQPGQTVELFGSDEEVAAR